MPTKWEYRTEILTSMVGRDKLRLNDLNSTLKKYGDAGWELVNLDIRADLKGSRDGHLLIFKREVEGALAPSPAASAVTLEADDSGEIAADQPDDGTRHSVVLLKTGKNKLSIVKTIKDATGASLGDIKKQVDAADGTDWRGRERETTPQTISSDLSERDAQALADALRSEGAEVEVR